MTTTSPRSAMTSEAIRDTAPLRADSFIAGALLCAVVAFVTLMRLTSEPNSPGMHDAGVGEGTVFAAHSLRAPNVPNALQTRPGAAGEIDALVALMHDLGMRRLVVCLASDEGERDFARHGESFSPITSFACGGDAARIDAAARDVAAVSPQAVIFAGTSDDAVAFIGRLRGNRSLAMVVLTSSIDRERVWRTLPARARTWVAAADRAPAADAASRPITIAMLANGRPRAP